MINLNQLRIFYHAARNRSFTLAAKELFITQPAVTAQVKSFENACSLKLFKKRGRGIHLTDDGKALYDYARRIFEWEKEMERAIQDLHELKRGVLRLGTTKAYARYFMPFLLTSFHQVYPEIKIHLNEGSSLDMIHSLLQFENEVAIIARAEDNPHVCFTPFSQEEIVLILPCGHRLAERPAVSIKDLAGEPIIMKEMGSGTRKVVSALFERHHLPPNILMETGNTEFIKQLVQKGEGISFLVKQAIVTEVGEKKLAAASLKEEKLFLDVSIAFLKDQPLSSPAQGFLQILEKLAKGQTPVCGIASILSQKQ
jgi:DNA-binding transcriptional LysR family regulator